MAITLRFVRHDDLPSRIISAAQMGFWATHVECVTPRGAYLGSRYDGGVRERSDTYDKTLWTKQLFVEILCPDEQAAQFLTWLRGKIGLPYDKKAILELAESLATSRLEQWDDSDGFICSALIAGGLHAVGLMACAPASIRLTTPRDLACSIGWGVVFSSPIIRTLA